MMVITGIIDGRVTCRTFCRRFAPSTSAASYRPGSMEVIEARKMMLPQPMLFQMWVMTTENRNQSGSARK